LVDNSFDILRLERLDRNLVLENDQEREIDRFRVLEFNIRTNKSVPVCSDRYQRSDRVISHRCGVGHIHHWQFVSRSGNKATEDYVEELDIDHILRSGGYLWRNRRDYSTNES